MDFGNLLAIIRDDGKFIPWDSDIDFGTTERSYEEFLKKLRNNEIQFPKEYFFVEKFESEFFLSDLKLGKLVHKESSLYLDIFVRRYNESQGFWYFPHFPHMFDDELFPLRKCTFEGMQFLCPNKPAQILKRRYDTLNPPLSYTMLFYSVQSWPIVIIFGFHLLVQIFIVIKIRKTPFSILICILFFINIFLIVPHYWHLGGYHLKILAASLVTTLLLGQFIHFNKLILKFFFYIFEIFCLLLIFIQFANIFSTQSCSAYRSLVCAVKESKYC